MRVLLVSSFTMDYVTRTDVSPPLSLLYVSSSLRAHGHEPVILDLTALSAPLGQEREAWFVGLILQALDDVRPGMVGLSCFMSASFPFVRRAAAAVKEARPGVPVVIGGVHPTLFAREILTHCPEIDVIVLGEGERQAVRLAAALQAEDRCGLEGIPGLAFRADDGRVVVAPQTSYVNDLDELPAPAWDLLDLERYYRDHSTWYNPRGLDIRMSVPILTSRACPRDCSFCLSHRMMGRGLRRRSATAVVDEMARVYETFGLSYFGFVDDQLTISKSHVVGICEEITRRGLVFQFESFNGYDLRTMDEEVVDAMVTAGCVYAIMPIEHGSDRMRKEVIGKPIPREQIFRTAELYKKHDLLTRGVFIMGFPEDTPATLQETYDMMVELDLDMYSVFNLIPFPGTRVFEQVVRDDLLVDAIDFDSFWQGNLDLNATRDRPYIRPYGMSLEELAEFRTRFDELRIRSRRARDLQRLAGGAPVDEAVDPPAVANAVTV